MDRCSSHFFSSWKGIVKAITGIPNFNARKSPLFKHNFVSNFMLQNLVHTTVLRNINMFFWLTKYGGIMCILEQIPHCGKGRIIYNRGVGGIFSRRGSFKKEFFEKVVLVLVSSLTFYVGNL